MTRFAVGHVLSQAFELVLRNFPVYLRTHGVFILAAAAIGLLLDLTVIRQFAGVTEADFLESSFEEAVALFLPVVAWSLATGIISYVVSALGAGVGVVTTDALLRGEHPTLGEAWARFSPRLGSFLVTVILLTLATIGVLVAGAFLFFLILPPLIGLVVAVYLLVRWAVAPVASVFEVHDSASENLRRASILTEGSRGGIFLLVLVFFLLNVVLTAALTSPFMPAVDFDVASEAADMTGTPTPMQTVGSTLVTTAVSLVMTPALTAALVLVYWALVAPPEPAAPTPGAPGDAGTTPGAPGPGAETGAPPRESGESPPP